MPLRGGGRSTPAPFTRGQKSRPFSPSPGKGDAELGNRSGLEVAAGRAWPWVQAGTSLGGAYPDSSPPPPHPRSVAGDPPRDLGGVGVGGSAGTDPPGRGCSGGSGPAGGAPTRSLGTVGAKFHRAAGAGGVGVTEFVTVPAAAPKPPRFSPKNERGGREGKGAGWDRARGCAPSVGQRRGHFCPFRWGFFFF